MVRGQGPGAMTGPHVWRAGCEGLPTEEAKAQAASVVSLAFG